MILNLFHGVGVTTEEAMRTFVDDKEFWTDSLFRHRRDGGTNFVRIMSGVRVTPQPAPVNRHMRKAAEIVVMLVSFRAPASSKLAEFDSRHDTQCIGMIRSFSVGIWHRDTNIIPNMRSSDGFATKKYVPLIGRQL
jgi:hypothetical protein